MREVLVFRKEKLVFLAMPKTGTTALEGALAPRASMVIREPADLKHAPCYRYQRFILPLLKTANIHDLEVMTLIRNPVDWLSSWFRYRCRDALIGHPNSTREVSFDAFVQEYCKGKPAPFANVGSQAKFLRDTDGNQSVDHLFRYEAQDSLMAFLKDRFGDFPAPKKLNVSPDFQVNLSPKTLDKLHRKRAAEFEAWEAAQH
ncbi:gamma-glutamyl kinase [Yoonia sp. R2331]|uniref:gamma-glutamyl kinase n=1 Tax=Yoonia sp. R2331 TaxID=3237238 RepID=UPI0034E5702C